MFKSKRRVECVGLKVEIQQTVSERFASLAQKTFRDKIISYFEVKEHRQD